MNSRKLLENWGMGALALTGILLFLIHGTEGRLVEFRIDHISLMLLAVVAIPYLASYLDSFKFGNLEARFRALSTSEQTFTFLSVFAAEHKLTFYDPREGEQQLGKAGQFLIQEMLRKDKRRTQREISNWLDSTQNNLRWFAAETIGYFELEDLSKDVKAAYSKLDKNVDWDDSHLNCIWAHSKLVDRFEELRDFLLETKSESNQIWLLSAFSQMAASKELPLGQANNVIERFLKRMDLTDRVMERAEKAQRSLKKRTQE